MSIVIEDVCKNFGNPPTEVIKHVDFTVKDGEFVSLTGKSGSGKSTLLYILSGLDFATSGSVVLDGNDFSKMPPDKLYDFRNRKMGFIFQFHYLIAELTAIENVLMPARRTEQHGKRRQYAEQLLDKFGLAGKENRYPRQLSGGEQQRVAIARALIMEPEYLFADEPTGALDSVNGNIVIDILREENKLRKTTIMMVTHDQEYAHKADREIILRDGKIESDLTVTENVIKS